MGDRQVFRILVTCRYAVIRGYVSHVRQLRLSGIWIAVGNSSFTHQAHREKNAPIHGGSRNSTVPVLAYPQCESHD